MANPEIRALTGTVAGLPTWLVVAFVAVVLVVVLLGGSDRGRGRRRRRSGRVGGLPILLMIGLMLGATPAGSNAIRIVITTLVQAMNAVGSLY